MFWDLDGIVCLMWSGWMVSFPHEKVLISTDARFEDAWLLTPSVPQHWQCRSAEPQSGPWLCIVLDGVQLFSTLVLQMFEFPFFDLHVSHTFLNLSKPQAGKAFFVSFQKLVLCWVVPPTLPLRVTWGGIAISLPFFSLFQRMVITSTASTSTTSFPENSCPFSGRDINAFFVFIFDSRRWLLTSDG